MNNTYTPAVMKELNQIRETFGVAAYERLMGVFFKMSEQYNRVYESREKWKKKYNDLVSATSDTKAKLGEKE